MSTPGQPELMSVEAILAETKEHKVTTRRRIAAGEFGPPIRIGRRLFVRKHDFLASLERHALHHVPSPSEKRQ